MNLALFEQAKTYYELTLDTAPTTFEWWSAYRDFSFGETGRMKYERNFLYPTIPAIISPATTDDELVHPIRYAETTHRMSTKLEYTESTDLLSIDAPATVVIDGVSYAKAANVDYQLKRFDKLISVQSGEIYFVADAHRATMATHTVSELIYRNPPADDEV